MRCLHPVQGEARADAVRHFPGNHAAQASFIEGYERGWDAHTARAATEVAKLERALDEELANRDGAVEQADALAYAIAPIEVIGEHSSGNDPWANAIEIAADRAAEVEQLKVRVRLLETMCDAAALLVGDRPWREMIDIALTEHGAEPR